MKKTVIELFAGVGGFHLGLKGAGWDVVWANQWEPGKKVQHAYDCYMSRFPEVEALNVDIAQVNDNPEEYPIPDHTLLVGGFPCQDYSVARTKADGIEGKKGVLFWEISRIIKSKQPPFVLLENVDRLLKSPAKQRGRDFAVMLATFRDLGYGVEWRVLNAADYGFAQRRRRVFIFAFHESTKYNKSLKKQSFEKILHGKGLFSQAFPVEKEYSKNHPPFKKELDHDIVKVSDTFSLTFRNSGIMLDSELYTEETIPQYVKPKTLGEILEKDVDKKYYLGPNLDDWNFMKGAKKIDRVSKTTGHKYTYAEGPVAFPDPLDKPGRTMLTSESSKNRSTHVVRDPQTGELRLLTPVECERLNDFPPNWTNTGMPEKFRYFTMGNALVVGLVTIMGETLDQIIKKESIRKAKVKNTPKIKSDTQQEQLSFKI
ncbi:DNA (cytosine-5)-methyltransferase 1 [Bacillus mesophilus]|uniref:DNA (cytosine-5-)-methyltransferase n=1 Tax=Bacillus mesophilus TaxID=1808955 RepID=A0A6M0Q7L1_9BACI|nr:DNA (cytosine-5-)-methyltransferase [Bacillus mesophilus]MBM7660389.1 DNA (cytosine-5)-methyltransferase 1 [Bacillus mesophilus]NEY71098.1 DNA (cytosine-5-)-methyltransferase [Bacillus mesophilus]